MDLPSYIPDLSPGGRDSLDDTHILSLDNISMSRRNKYKFLTFNESYMSPVSIKNSPLKESVPLSIRGQNTPLPLDFDAITQSSQRSQRQQSQAPPQRQTRGHAQGLQQLLLPLLPLLLPVKTRMYSSPTKTYTDHINALRSTPASPIKPKREKLDATSSKYMTVAAERDTLMREVEYLRKVIKQRDSDFNYLEQQVEKLKSEKQDLELNERRIKKELEDHHINETKKLKKEHDSFLEKMKKSQVELQNDNTVLRKAKYVLEEDVLELKRVLTRCDDERLRLKAKLKQYVELLNRLREQLGNKEKMTISDDYYSEAKQVEPEPKPEPKPKPKPEPEQNSKSGSPPQGHPELTQNLLDILQKLSNTLTQTSNNAKLPYLGSANSPESMVSKDQSRTSSEQKTATSDLCQLCGEGEYKQESRNATGTKAETGAKPNTSPHTRTCANKEKDVQDLNNVNLESKSSLANSKISIISVDGKICFKISSNGAIQLEFEGADLQGTLRDSFKDGTNESLVHDVLQNMPHSVSAESGNNFEVKATVPPNQTKDGVSSSISKRSNSKDGNTTSGSSISTSSMKNRSATVVDPVKEKLASYFVLETTEDLPQNPSSHIKDLESNHDVASISRFEPELVSKESPLFVEASDCKVKEDVMSKCEKRTSLDSVSQSLDVESNQQEERKTFDFDSSRLDTGYFVQDNILYDKSTIGHHCSPCFGNEDYTESDIGRKIYDIPGAV